MGNVTNNITINVVNLDGISINSGKFFEFAGTSSNLIFQNLDLNLINGTVLTFLELTGDISTSITLETWDIQNSEFDENFILAYFPAGKSIPSFSISDITLTTNVTLKNSEMF